MDDPGADYGDVIVPVTAGPFPGSTNVHKTGGDQPERATFTGSSPAFQITADDVVISGPGILDGWTGTANNATAAVEVFAGADNFNLLNTEVKRWKDGVELKGTWFPSRSSATGSTTTPTPACRSTPGS